MEKKWRERGGGGRGRGNIKGWSGEGGKGVQSAGMGIGVIGPVELRSSKVLIALRTEWPYYSYLFS